MIEICGNVDENDRCELITDFEENAVYTGNCFDGFFEQINSCRFGKKLFVEIQKLGDHDGFYKNWSMKNICRLCMKSARIWMGFG